MRGQSFQTSAALLIVLLASTIFCGCKRGGSDAGNSASASASPQRPKPLTAFDRDLDYVRTGRFTHIYVIARPDNGVITKDDITYLKENTPKETNQWVSTDENRRVIAGTNFVFTPEHLDALRQRFIVEDYSGR
ncbi:MAG: hypothetical protein WCF57_16690 [Pyrinomonadaceae bacterium]